MRKMRTFKNRERNRLMRMNHRLDYPGKKHMIIILNGNGKPVGYRLMTIEEQIIEQLMLKGM